MPRPERHMVHRILPEAAIGIEDVPFDEQGLLPGLGQAVEVVPILLSDGVEFGVGEVFGGWFGR